VDDPSLLPALRRGDAAVWRQALEAHMPALIGYATRMTGDRSTGEEAVQEALISVYRSIDRFEGRCSFRSWLFRAVHNRSVDAIKRRGRYVNAGEGDPTEALFDEKGHWRNACPDWTVQMDEQLDARRRLAEVRRQVDRLPHDLRDVVLLKEVQGLETPEVCEALGITATNMRVRLHRARKALRVALTRAQGGA